MDLNLIADKSHRILGEVNGLEDDLEGLGEELDEPKEAVQQLQDDAEKKTEGLVQMVAVSQTNQVGVVIGLGLVGAIVLVVALLLCLILRRMKRMKVGARFRAVSDILSDVWFSFPDRRPFSRHSSWSRSCPCRNGWRSRCSRSQRLRGGGADPH